MSYTYTYRVCLLFLGVLSLRHLFNSPVCAINSPIPDSPTSQPTGQPTSYIAASGKFVSTHIGLSRVSMLSRGDGQKAQAAVLVQPSDVALDTQGNIYVAEANYIRKVSVLTNIVSTIAGGGASTSVGADALDFKMESVSALTVTTDGTVFFIDSSTCCVQGIHNETSRIFTVAGQCGQCGFDGDGVSATLSVLGIFFSFIFSYYVL